jgi:hypothetical protein
MIVYLFHILFSFIFIGLVIILYFYNLDLSTLHFDSESDFINEFIKICDLASCYDESVRAFQQKLLDLEEDKELFYTNKTYELAKFSGNDFKRKLYLDSLKWDNDKINKYYEFKRNIYISERDSHLRNAMEQEKKIYK